MTKTSVAVVGCGAIAQMMHVPHLQRLADRFELAAVCDLSPRLARSVAERFHIPRWTTDHRELLGPDIHAVLVLTGGSHAPICLDFARAGKHIFVEKPLCYTPAEGRELAAAVKASGVQLMVGYMKRFDPGYRYAQKAVAGAPAPRYVQVTVLHPNEGPFLQHHRLLRGGDLPSEQIDSLIAQSRRLAREAIGDAPDWMLDCYHDVLLGSVVHDLNATRHLVGEPVEVLSAQIWAGGQAVSTDLRFAGGFIGHYAWCFLNDLRHYVEEVGIYGEAQRVTLQFPSPYLRNCPTPVIVEQMDGEANTCNHVLVNYEEAFEQELVHFHECVATAKAPISPVADGLRDVVILQAVAKAACSGKPQPIPNLEV